MSKVSIIIPVYNGSNYLSQAIDSALNQSYKNIEVIVINDGSNDKGKSEKIARSYKSKIRYFKKKNGGVGSALNYGIKQMKGEYFSWLSHDDLYAKGKISKQIKLVKKQQNASIIYSDFSFISKNGKRISTKKIPSFPPKDFRYRLTESSFVHGCSILVPKEAFDKVGLFNEDLKTTQDYDLWFRMASFYPFIHIPHILAYGRLHEGQGTVTMKPLVKAERNNLHIEFLNNLNLEEILSHHKSLSSGYIYLSNNFIKRKLFKTSIYSAYKSIVSSKDTKQLLSSCKQLIYSLFVSIVETVRP